MCHLFEDRFYLGITEHLGFYESNSACILNKVCDLQHSLIVRYGGGCGKLRTSADHIQVVNILNEGCGRVYLKGYGGWKED